jgi:uncharacterized protein (TIGR00297 family)
MFELSFQFSLTQFVIGLGLGAVIAAVAWRLGALNPSGALVAALLGGLTYGIGGLPAAILLIAFFASSSLLTRLFSRRKRNAAKDFAKGGRRDWAQVLANGGVGLLALLAGAFSWIPTPLAWAAFAGALATANADTWATELGVLSSKVPLLITTGKKVPVGTSGGVSLRGSAAALGGAALIAALAALFAGSWQILLLVALAGLLGSFFDSTLGATVQAIYYCPKCKKETERHPVHSCGTPTTPRRGWPWLDNDWVNFLSSLAGALLTVGTASFLL